MVYGGKQGDVPRYECRGAKAHIGEAVDPDNRLVATELEARWNASLRQVQDVDRKLQEARRDRPNSHRVDKETLLALACDLPAVWNDGASDMRLK